MHACGFLLVFFCGKGAKRRIAYPPVSRGDLNRATPRFGARGVGVP